jgi:hypothetical protein
MQMVKVSTLEDKVLLLAMAGMSFHKTFLTNNLPPLFNKTLRKTYNSANREKQKSPE